RHIMTEAASERIPSCPEVALLIEVRSRTYSTITPALHPKLSPASPPAWHIELGVAAEQDGQRPADEHAHGDGAVEKPGHGRAADAGEGPARLKHALPLSRRVHPAAHAAAKPVYLRISGLWKPSTMLSRGMPASTSSVATPSSVPSYWIQMRPSQMSTCTI